MREDAVPHEGQEAVGNVVRRVSVISSATSTSSTSISGRSGKMIIGFLSILEKVKQEKMFNLLVYHKCDQQSCVTTKLSGNRQFALQCEHWCERIWANRSISRVSSEKVVNTPNALGSY